MNGRGWLIWFVLSVGTFGWFEGRALVRRRPQDTLSDAIWRMEHLRTGQPIYQWTFGHLMFTGLIALLFGWLFFHFSLGWWR